MSIETLISTISKLTLNSTDSDISDSTNAQSSTDYLIANKAKQKTMAFKVEYLNCVPNFDGNPNDLQEFLDSAESIIDTFFDVSNPTCFQNIYVFKSISNKLTGSAKTAVNIQQPTNWIELKETLNRNFCDQRDDTCLVRDLVLLKQNNDKPLAFYEKCTKLLNLLCSYVNANETETAVKTAKRKFFAKLALKSFLCGLREPLGSTIRAMRPDTIQKALQYIMEEDNARYYRHDQKPNFQNQNASNFPSQPINIKPKQNLPQQKYFSNQQVFGKQPQAGPAAKNVFRPNPNYRPQPPTPMSGVSGNSGNRGPQFHNFQKRKNSEIHHQESEEDFYDNDVDPEPENVSLDNENDCYDESNFCEIPEQTEKT